MVGWVVLWLGGCVGTSQVTIAPTLVVTPNLIIGTPTASASVAGTRLISGKSIHDYFWTPDSQALVYAQSDKCPTGCKTTWYRFDVTSGVTTTFNLAVVTIDPRVWKRLTNGGDPPEISPQQSRSISPSGKWVIYSRVSPSYTPSPCLKGPCLPPIEVWVSSIGGSEAFKVADATEHGTSCMGLGWFDQERKALLMCGYEGPVHFVVADMQKLVLTKLDDLVKQHIITLDWAELSPDGAKLAVNNIVTKSVELEVFPLGGSAKLDLGPAAQAHWSADGQRLYYLQRVAPDKCAPAAIHVYDFATTQNKVVLGPEVVLSSAQRVTLDACDHAFLVSPAEDAVLLVLNESGSWFVGLH